MPKLTPEERKRLIRLIEEQSPLGQEWLEKLFPLSSSGELFWKGKAEIRARTRELLSSHDEPAKKLRTSSSPVPHDLDLFAPDLPSPNLLTPDPFSPSLSADWAGLLFQADNLSLLRYLLQNGSSFGLSASPFSLIYIDPPFFTETDFHATAPRAAKKRKGLRATQKGAEAQALEVGEKDQSLSQKLTRSLPQSEGEKNDSKLTQERIFAYSDTWKGGKAAYFNMLYERIIFMHALLSAKGILCVHCDWRAVPGVRFMLDECFGQGSFVNEIIWHYTGGGRSKRYFSRKHDSILVYAKGKEWTFNIDAVRVPYKETSGYAKGGIVSQAGKRYMPHPSGKPLDDVWDIPMVNPMAKERVAYATQKPRLLLKRVIEAFSNEGDLVGDFFCGSGTTLLEALANKRRVIGCDFGAQAVAVTHERLKEHGLVSLEHELIASPHLSQPSQGNSLQNLCSPSCFSFRSAD